MGGKDQNAQQQILNLFYSPDSIYKIKKDTIFELNGYRDNLSPCVSRRVFYSPHDHKNIKYLGEDLPGQKNDSLGQQKRFNQNLLKRPQVYQNGFFSRHPKYRFKAVKTGKSIIYLTVSSHGEVSKQIF